MLVYSEGFIFIFPFYSDIYKVQGSMMVLKSKVLWWYWRARFYDGTRPRFYDGTRARFYDGTRARFYDGTEEQGSMMVLE